MATKNRGAARKVRLTFTEEVLGSSNNDPEVFDNFMRKRMVAEMVKSGMSEEEAQVRVTEEMGDHEFDGDEKRTVFPKLEDGTPFIYNYQIKGAFKDAASALRRVPNSETHGYTETVNGKKVEHKGMAAFKKEIDGTIFVNERRIPYQMPEGSVIGNCQRPLRASTPQGERVCLASSETVPAGTVIEFTVTSLNKANWRFIEEWLNYLQLRGIGQWRNSGKGSCTWEYVD